MENNQAFNITQEMIMTSRNDLTAMNSSFVLQSYLDDFSYSNPLFYSYKRSFSRDEASSLGGVGSSSSAMCNSTELQEEAAKFMAAKAAAAAAGHGLQENLNNLAISVPQMYSSDDVLSGFVSNENNNNNSYVTYNHQWGDVELVGKTSEFHQTFDPNVWNSNNNHNGSSDFSNELSLSLATSQPSVITGMATTIPGQCSDMSRSAALPARNTETVLVSEQTSCNNNKVISPSFGSYRPLQLSQVILGSRYLSAAQEILAHFASFSLENIGHDHSSSSYLMNSCSLSTMSPMDSTSDGGRLEGETESESHRRQLETKRAKLLSLLQLVDDRYNQCLDEIHTVVSAFHAATELDPQIHARFALQTISVLYKGLRERISKHCLAMGATSFDQLGRESSGSDKSFETSFIQKQWALQQLKKKDQLWRPQRGLPERSVSVLRAWMFQNFLHPYPKDAEKHLLAVKSGLTRNQVSNWFINARVRLWKPMIEEMYAELNRRKENNNQRISINDNNNNNINQIQRYN
ncbi:homeobox protein ATH1-like [Humulus lupulus]|uniref:homeobox protein ATH1-like n=1 Tax=Humulus lupulus TaxID=3486 RepID=UPI002B40469C|nr:homeobox protein ATH1-like [Humulus lupulus]